MSKSQSWKSTNVKNGISYAERLRLANSQNQNQNSNSNSNNRHNQNQNQQSEPTSTSISGGGKHLHPTNLNLNNPNPKVSLPPQSSSSNSSSKLTIPDSSSSNQVAPLTTTTTSSSSSSSTTPSLSSTSLKPSKNPWTERKLQLEQRNRERLEEENRKSTKGKEKEVESSGEGKIALIEKAKETEQKASLPKKETPGSNNGDKASEISVPATKDGRQFNVKVGKPKSWADVASKNQKKSTIPSSAISGSSSSSSPQVSNQVQSQASNQTREPSVQSQIKNSTPPPTSIPTSSISTTSTSSTTSTLTSPPIIDSKASNTNTNPEKESRSIAGNSDNQHSSIKDHQVVIETKTQEQASSKTQIADSSPWGNSKMAGVNGPSGSRTSRRMARTRRRSKSSSSGSLNLSNKDSSTASFNEPSRDDEEPRLDSSDWPEVSGGLKGSKSKGNGNHKEKEKETDPGIIGGEGGSLKPIEDTINNDKDLELGDQFRDLDLKLSGREKKDKNGKNWISVVPEISVSVSSSSNGTNSGSGSGRKNRKNKLDYSSAVDHYEALKRKGKTTTASKPPSTNEKSKAVLRSSSQKIEKESSPITRDQDQLEKQVQPLDQIVEPKIPVPEESNIFPKSEISSNEERKGEIGQSDYPAPESHPSPQSQLETPLYSDHQDLSNQFPAHDLQSNGTSIPVDSNYDPSIINSVPAGPYYQVNQEQFWNRGQRGGTRRGRNGRGRGRNQFQRYQGNPYDHHFAAQQFGVDSREYNHDYMPQNLNQTTFISADSSSIPHSNLNETSNHSSVANPVTTSPTHALLNQIEFYFSQRNLQGDFYLRNQMNPFGFVPISVVSNFNRVKKLTNDLDLVRNTLLYSQVLEVSHDGSMVRKKWGWEEFVMPNVRAGNQFENGNGYQSNHYSPQNQFSRPNDQAFNAFHQHESFHNQSDRALPRSQIQHLDYQSSIQPSSTMQYPPPFQTEQTNSLSIQSASFQPNQNHSHLTPNHHQQPQSFSSSSMSNYQIPSNNEISSATTPTTNEDNHSKTSTFSSPPSTFSLSRGSDEEDLTLDDDDVEEVLGSKDDVSSASGSIAER